MPTTIIKNIRAEDIPFQWLKDIKGKTNQTFTIIIRPEGIILPEESPAQRRNRMMKMLEGNNGDESSEEWIQLIKSSRTISPLKTDFE
ncbi:Uncharacterized protein dnl_49810 [Desulfonema limicola]|uniref:Uncharacterized protein n=1 Tax=Desulfonema limicola TaxID=45656 RepID=A0A975GJ54_9BACT|nr:hypothetical protein [Desulfonema limicola]QTA82603.1 Uncharacterized protein dnl_49810 [Desulfonema limicola]